MMTGALDPLLERWIALFRGPLTGLLASGGASWHEAEELAMDTFAEAWLGRDRLRGDAQDSAVVGPWLRGIARNLEHSRRRRAAVHRFEPLPPELAAPSAETDERLEALRIAFGELRPEHQTVLRMFYLDAASTKEVAALLDVTPKAIESRLFQARRALRVAADRVRATAAGGTS
ncbi:MAG: sigma-70 family RNA polymerase sigma factor [Planctomycetes bacterium]|nr:sigma-70 family RNA polymerase sigma factor [Planctomycetota bacterium]